MFIRCVHVLNLVVCTEFADDGASKTWRAPKVISIRPPPPKEGAFEDPRTLINRGMSKMSSVASTASDSVARSVVKRAPTLKGSSDRDGSPTKALKNKLKSMKSMADSVNQNMSQMISTMVGDSDKSLHAPSNEAECMVLDNYRIVRVSLYTLDGQNMAVSDLIQESGFESIRSNLNSARRARCVPHPLGQGSGRVLTPYE